MNPLLLVGADLFISACLTFLVLYVTWRRFQPHTPGLKKAVNTDAAAEAAPSARGGKGIEETAPDDKFDDEDITRHVERLREKGLSAEKIAGQLKVPTGEVEMILALSKMKKVGRVAQLKNPPQDLRKGKRPGGGGKGEMRGYPPPSARRQPQKVILDKQVL